MADFEQITFNYATAYILTVMCNIALPARVNPGYIHRGIVMGNKKGIVSRLLVALILVIGASSLFIGCGPEPEVPVYTKENITLKFKNDSGLPCHIEITGRSDSGTIFDTTDWESSFDFPSVLKPEIPTGGSEKIITIKDVVVFGKSQKREYNYNPVFDIHVISEDSVYKSSWNRFKATSKDQYSSGIFHIKKGKDEYNKDALIVDFSN